MPTIHLTNAEHAAVAAALRRAIEDDRYPHAPRLDPLRAALARFEAAMGGDRKSKSSLDSKLESASSKKALTRAKVDKGARSAKAPAPKISPGFKLGRLPPDR